MFGGVILLSTACFSAHGSSDTIDSGTTDTINVIDTIGKSPSDSSKPESRLNVPSGAKALINSYPDFIKGYEDGKIIFTDGSTMIYDDGREKDFPTMLDDSDMEDMFYVAYEQPSEGQVPEYLADAGRSRNEDLFKKMYGNSSATVQKKLVNVPWFGQNVKFTSVNGAADQLKKVAEELERYPELRKYLKSSGTFYWRPVRGAKRLSAHSYGIAFDIGVDHSDYWLWKNSGANETAKIKYANRIPHQIVDIFRKHGFIWGGSWYHFDTMHFEYRPEILEYSRITSEESRE